jgi:hypothetical protein
MNKRDESGKSRVNAQKIAKLRAKFKGAERRVKSLKASIAELDTIIANGYETIQSGKNSMRVKLSVPEIRDLIDERNNLKIDLVRTEQDLKEYKSDFSNAVFLNSRISKVRLAGLRAKITNDHVQKVTKLVQLRLNQAVTNELRAEVIGLKELGLADGVNAAFTRKLVSIIRKSGSSDFRYLPKASGTEILEGLKKWNDTEVGQPVFTVQ